MNGRVVVSWLGMGRPGRDEAAVRPQMGRLTYQPLLSHGLPTEGTPNGGRQPTEGITPTSTHFHSFHSLHPQPHRPRITITAQYPTTCNLTPITPRTHSKSNTLPPKRQPAPRAHAKAWPAKHSAAWLRIMLKWGEKGWGLPRAVRSWSGQGGVVQLKRRRAMLGGWRVCAPSYCTCYEVVIDLR